MQPESENNEEISINHESKNTYVRSVFKCVSQTFSIFVSVCIIYSAAPYDDKLPAGCGYKCMKCNANGHSQQPANNQP